MNTLLLVLTLTFSLIPLPARERYHVPVAYDDERSLTYQMPYIDMDVVDNDSGSGQNAMRVVAVSITQGQRAEIIDETTVRVYIDWANYLAGATLDRAVMGRVAHGTYIVSNGYAQSVASWTVWYRPVLTV